MPQCMESSFLILKQLESWEIFRKSRRILFYHALPDEVQTDFFLNRHASEKEFFLPVVAEDHLLICPYDQSRIAKGAFSIPEPQGVMPVEPEIIDLAIIPGVAFDMRGNRLGRGKGFYDRLLPYLDCPCIGIGYDWQLVPEIPTEPFDRPLDGIITESEFILRTSFEDLRK